LDVLQRKDKFEGSIPASLQNAWRVRFSDLDTQARLSAGNRYGLTRFYVSCWHANEDESDAMWRLYGALPGGVDGVALQTTYEKFDASLPSTIGLGMVQYVDYDTWQLPVAPNAFDLVMHKRRAFAHEREVRAVYLSPANITITGNADKVKIFDPRGASVLVAWYVDWEPERVLERIYVSPYAEEWYRDAVLAVIERFAPELAARLSWSPMRAEPIY
jgi:hypothetical protein